MTSPSVLIPTVEPRQLIAGDTWLWNRVFPEFPSSAWTLTYYIRGASAIDIVGTTDPDTVTYNLVKAANLTAAVIPGAYRYFAKVSGGSSEVHTVREGDFQIAPNAQTAAAGALQPHAEIMLAAVEAELQARAGLSAINTPGGVASAATSPGSWHEKIVIGGREITKTPTLELKRLRSEYRNEIALLENRGTLPDIAAVFQGTRHGGPFLFDAP